MKTAPVPPDEPARLEALAAHALLDTPPEEAFDALTRLAARLCGTPIALVSLVDGARQWFKSRVGLEEPETTREVAFCAHAILQDGLFVVRDACQDERFCDNPLVTSEPRVRFYAGTPLKSLSGHTLGTLCVIDHVPRELTAEQAQALQVLGRQVEAQLQLRLRVKELERREAESRAQREALARLKRQKDGLLQLVVKDLQTPLSAIHSHAAQVQSRSYLPEDVRGAAHHIREGTESVQRLVANLLEASQEDAPLVTRPSEFDVTALLSEVARDFALRTQGTRRQFSHWARVAERHITADRQMLRRAVDNLLDNSFRFTALSGGQVTLEALQPEPDLLELRVRDDGPSIPASARAHVFEAHPPEEVLAPDRARASSSLGLAFCRHVVEAHGGWIWVEENMPKGVVFCLRIPVRPRAATASEVR
jgi:signal transduction histidine kinase